MNSGVHWLSVSFFLPFDCGSCETEPSAARSVNRSPGSRRSFCTPDGATYSVSLK